MTYNEALSAHYRRLETDPMYRMLEAMEDMRVDMIPGHWIESEEAIPKDEPKWNKKQWDTINQLCSEQKNIRNLIYKTLKENKEKSSNKSYEPF